jgi:alpha/beta superfamily hydrolase
VIPVTVVALETTDGTALSAEFSPSATVSTLAAAVLLHPHPTMGGDMFAPVPDHLFRNLPAEGFAVLRFDFRGAGSSGGTHGGGAPEALDVAAAVEHLTEVAGQPVWLVGWSFGADVSLQVIHPAIAGWVCIAAPLRSVPIDAMSARSDPRPKHLLVPEHDQFAPPEVVEEAVAEWANTTIQPIPGADHFLNGRLGAVNLATAAILEGGT